MNKIMLFFLMTHMSTAQAEVFKCVLKGKTVYQSEPCPRTAVKQTEIKIEKPDPAKIAEEEAKLKVWKEDFAKQEAAELEAKKQRQAELDRQAEIDAINRSAKAQEEAAKAAQQPVIINPPYVIDPYYSPYHKYRYPGGYDYRPPHHHGHWPKPQPQPKPPNKSTFTN
ncbi:MAG: DUF4124 domain-containing protein [Methylobacter sp.]